MEIFDEIHQGAEDKCITALMALDQSAAFDCVNWQLLLQKTGEIWSRSRRERLDTRLFNIQNSICGDWGRAVQYEAGPLGGPPGLGDRPPSLCDFHQRDVQGCEEARLPELSSSGQTRSSLADNVQIVESCPHMLTTRHMRCQGGIDKGTRTV